MSTIAVLPPVNKSKLAWLSGPGTQAAQDVFVTELVKTPKYSVISSSELANRLKANQLTITSDSPPAAIAQAAQKIKVDDIVICLFEAFGSVESFRAQVKVIRLASGQAVWTGATPAIQSVSNLAEFNLRAAPALKALVAQLKAAV